VGSVSSLSCEYGQFSRKVFDRKGITWMVITEVTSALLRYYLSIGIQATLALRLYDQNCSMEPPSHKLLVLYILSTAAVSLSLELLLRLVYNYLPEKFLLLWLL
jgi:hypothetical protein